MWRVLYSSVNVERSFCATKRKTTRKNKARFFGHEGQVIAGGVIAVCVRWHILWGVGGEHISGGSSVGGVWLWFLLGSCPEWVALWGGDNWVKLVLRLSHGVLQKHSRRVTSRQWQMNNLWVRVYGFCKFLHRSVRSDFNWMCWIHKKKSDLVIEFQRIPTLCTLSAERTKVRHCVLTRCHRTFWVVWCVEWFNWTTKICGRLLDENNQSCCSGALLTKCHPDLCARTYSCILSYSFWGMDILHTAFEWVRILWTFVQLCSAHDNDSYQDVFRSCNAENETRLQQLYLNSRPLSRLPRSRFYASRKLSSKRIWPCRGQTYICVPESPAICSILVAKWYS